MELSILDAEDQNMFRLFEITSQAFGRTEPFWNASWPYHWTHAGRQDGAQRFINTKHSDPKTKYLKAVDHSSGRIVGMARWNIFLENSPNYVKPDSQQRVDAGTNEEANAYQKYLAEQFFAERRDALARSNGNLVCLDMLAVDPAYQRKGVGSALVAWGTRKADELGLDVVVEGSAAGRSVYEKHGFALFKTIQICVPSKWAHWGGQDYCWLVRSEKI